MNQKNDSWADAYAAQFGRVLSTSEVNAWTNEIREAFTKTRPWPGEAARAIRALAASWPTDDGKGNRNAFPPTCRDLISQMKAERRKAFTSAGSHTVLSQTRSMLPNRTEYQRTASHSENTEDWQRELREAGRHERWSIICRPANNDQCAEREAYCNSQGLEYDTFVPSSALYDNALGCGNNVG